MANGIVTCPKCVAPLPANLLNRSELVKCPACQSRLLAKVFPALVTPREAAQVGETVLTEGEASCFYHPTKRAVRPCDQCGRFLCSLCDLDLHGHHICPDCLNSPHDPQITTALETKRVLYDSAACTISLLPVLIWPVTLITAPVAFVLGVYSFRKKSSLIPRTRIRAWLALLFSAATMAGWALLFTSVFFD